MLSEGGSVSQRDQKDVGEEGKTIGVRLREERIRLRMTQQKFGSAGGVRTDAQYKYESGCAYQGWIISRSYPRSAQTFTT